MARSGDGRMCLPDHPRPLIVQAGRLCGWATSAIEGNGEGNGGIGAAGTRCSPVNRTGSIPPTSTKCKGSDNLRALFLCAIPRATRGSGHLCCGWPATKTSGNRPEPSPLFRWICGEAQPCSAKIKRLRATVRCQPRPPVRHRTVHRGDKQGNLAVS